LRFQFVLSCQRREKTPENSGNIVEAAAAMRCSQKNDTSCGIDDFSAITMVLVGEYQCFLDDEPTQAVRNENQWAIFLFKLVSAISGEGVQSYLLTGCALLRQAL
jgi:hypothetical protein